MKRFRVAIPVLATGLLLAAGVLSAQATTLSYQLVLDPADVDVRGTAAGHAVSVRADGYSTLADEGRPALPYRIVSVLLPQGHELASFAADARGTTVIATRVSPVLADAMRTEDGVAGQSTALVSLASGGAFPAERARLLGVGTLHGYTIASFAVYPLSLSGEDLVAYPAVTLEIETTPSAQPAPVHMVRRRPRAMQRIQGELSRLVINSADAAGYSFGAVDVPAPDGGFAPSTFPSLEGSAVDYVIVTPDSLAAAYQALADFKTGKGVPTVVRTTEWIEANYRNGSDPQETIRNFVKDAYAKWGITYLLLGGDTGEIAPRLAWSGFYDGGRFLPVDMYFGCLDGSWNADGDAIFGEGTPIDGADLYAEVYVGRLPTSSVAEVAMMTGKVIAYETPADLSFGHRVLLLGEVLFPLNWSPPQAITVNGADLTETIYNNHLTAPGLDVVRMYETQEYFPGSVDENRAAVLDSLNTGFNHVVHIGHGYRFNMSVSDASIVNSDADALINGNRLSCLYFLNCTGASYTYYCLAEHFLRNPNGGAVSVVGANESAFPNASSAYMNEYYKLAFDSAVTNIGETFARSRALRTPLALLGDNVDLWTHYIYTLLADPELPMWTHRPATTDVTHAASVSAGKQNILVTVMSGGNPVEGATVCLTKGGDDYAVATTDMSGQATLPFRARSPGAIDVVVTGHNQRRYDGTITVTAAAAYVQIAGMTVDDDNTGGTAGNGNGVIEGGETVDLALSLKNTGPVSTGDVTVTLRSSDPGVVLDDSTAAAGVIASGATVVAGGGVRVTFDDAYPDAYPVPFTLVIKNDGGEAWRDTFKKEVHQPGLFQVTLRIDDVANGNGDGIVDAGEQFHLFYKVKNFGTGAFPGGSATITDLDAGFTLIGANDSYAAVAPMAEAENTAGFEMIETSVASEHRLLVEIVDTYGRSYQDIVELRPPVAPVGLVIDPSLGPDRLQVFWSASVSGDAETYHVYRSTTPVGPWVKSTVDPVSHTVFLDRGLTSNSLYYFRATTIDTSGNESAPSAVASGSTNPQQVSGFPLPLGSETSSSPVVGDIDGDGDLEIVVCADKVYAFNSDGSEVINGDGDAQTWGVLSPVGGSFVAHAALARLDAAPGLEVIAASRDLKQVYVFNHQGALLPGWPRSAENFVRAGVAAGDLDGDNLLEVIAVDEKGVIYAWNADGSEFIDGDFNPLTQGVFFRMPNCTFNYSTPAMADIDGDNMEELIVGSQGDQLYVFNEDGSVSPGWPYALASDVAGSPAIGDVDNNGDLEIVVNTAAGNLFVINHDATLQMSQYFSNAPWNPFFASSPAIGNVTGDGKLEIFVARGSGNIYGTQSNGVVLAGWPRQYTTTTYTESSPVIADVDGDGNPDIVIGSETQYLYAWNVSGQLIAGFPLKTDDAMRGVPELNDVDQDGDIDLVAAGWDKSLYVWDFSGSWNPATAPWPRFHANAHNNGAHGFVVPTPVGGASFRYAALGGGMELVWTVPLSASGGLFNVSRAELKDDAPGPYRRVASAVGLSMDGEVRVVDRGVEMGSRYVYRLEGEGGVVNETLAVLVPVTIAKLGQNHPNPFNPVTSIDYWVPGGIRNAVSLVIYDVRGARVRTLVNEHKAAGRYQSRWDGRNDAGAPVSSGVYFYRMVAGGFTDTRKMLLVK
ncbi:MAG: C25 family cysteine peptidase [Candidatus Krumholzibacteria bacterium]|nr:C25 family cysteine peptidase [Candidatus Krumholzibacteria bacterium]MDH4335976.1 C25 family cysteine peptidase [Candidatus Krumholzibacteria bacterium]MDH5268448.1 C25 family cysteine peptidase [Candidatus Krumholzibacteria bacterium]